MLDEDVRTLASGASCAAVSTMMPNGAIQTHIMWVDCESEHLRINTEVHRQKFKNIERDPRITVTLWEGSQPYRYVEVRGQVVEIIKGEAALEHIDRLAMRYAGRTFSREAIKSERVILKVLPERIVRYP